jgi:beta-lactam-binding protein with PASTA domain/predicted Ser/Thr protein kinase
MTTPRLLSNRYELLGETLGYGGMSEVHKGRDVRLSRDVAIKVLRADLARDPQFQERFRREAQNAAALNHPAIVAVYDTGETRTEHGPLPYIVMEYVDGRTLRDIVKSEGPLPAKRAMEVMADVCAALDFSHRHGIVHRDVKPANVMITKTGAVKVMDFGIARALSDGQAAVTQTAAVIGTAQYLSPEQARGEAVDARSDVYAAGCVLFELLTSEPPFTGDSPVAVAYQHVREDPKPPSTLNRSVPPQLDAIVLKAMSKGPANRYQSSAEMRGDLVRVLSGQRPAAPMVMTDEDRTSIMNGGRTEVMGGGGRHRPSAVADDYDDYDDEDEAARRRRRGWMIAGWVIGAIVVIALLAFVLPKLLGGSSSGGNADSVSVPALVGQKQADAIKALNALGLSPVPQTEVCGKADATGAIPCQANQVGLVISSNPASGTSVNKGDQVTIMVGLAPQPVPVPDLTGMSPDDAQKALQAAGLTLAASPATEPTNDQDKIGKVISQNPAPPNTAPPGSAVAITLGAAPENVTVPDERGKQYSDAKADLVNKGFKVTKQTEDNQAPANQVVDMNPSAQTQVAPGTSVQLIVSNGSQAQINMPNLVTLTQQEAQSKLAGMGWTGHFNVDTQLTTDPNKDGQISDQSPEPNQQIDKDETVNISVWKFPGGSPPSSGGIGFPGG